MKWWININILIWKYNSVGLFRIRIIDRVFEELCNELCGVYRYRVVLEIFLFLFYIKIVKSVVEKLNYWYYIGEYLFYWKMEF